MKLFNIQQELKIKKNNYNSSGGYKYRSAEDIINALKPILKKYKCTLKIDEELICINNKIYIKSTANLIEESENCVDNKTIDFSSAYAREADFQTGMNVAQITGSTSSYAKKYALCNLFAIDDGIDPDLTNQHSKEINDDGRYDESIREQIEKCGMVDEAQGWENFSLQEKASLLVRYNNYEKQLRKNGKIK